jgi:glycosyltransferase involved in cell wall biosynthesis
MSKGPEPRPADGAALVVLAYGESPFLSQCLTSLAAQVEQTPIIVATSTPCDHIIMAAKTVGAVVRVNPTHRGIAGDWNFGLHASESRYVTLAHQDDVYSPDFVRQSIKALSASSEAVLAFTGYQEIDDAGVAKSSKISRIKHLIEAVTLGGARSVRGMRLRLYLSFGNPLPCSSVTFDRSRLPQFAFSADYGSNLDWDAWWRLMHARRHLRPRAGAPGGPAPQRAHRHLQAHRRRNAPDGRPGDVPPRLAQAARRRHRADLPRWLLMPCRPT